jgi:hypothetical protein
MTANFDTPLTGVFYAMEINRLLIKDRAPRVSDPPTGPPVKGNLDLYNNIQVRDMIMNANLLRYFSHAFFRTSLCFYVHI